VDGELERGVDFDLERWIRYGQRFGCVQRCRQHGSRAQRHAQRCRKDVHGFAGGRPGAAIMLDFDCSDRSVGR